MSDLAAFLLARIAEDEAVAREALTEHRWEVSLEETNDRENIFYAVTAGPTDDDVFADMGSHRMDSTRAQHIARHDPARVLAECAAKRRIVREHASTKVDGERFCAICAAGEVHEMLYPCPTLRALAQPYADHPDFAEEWRDERP